MNILYKKDRIVFLAQYDNPQMHRHFLKHILVSEKPFLCKTREERVSTKSITIKSNVWHSVERAQDVPMLVYLIDETSELSTAVDKISLQDKAISRLPAALEKGITELMAQKTPLDVIDQFLIEQIQEKNNDKRPVDRRISKAVQLIEECESINSSIYELSAEKAFLSKSRFLHLFKEEMGIDFRNYLLMKKLEKTYTYVTKKEMSITDAALLAGFSSSSHFASACKSHFGISFTDFLKAQS